MAAEKKQVAKGLMLCPVCRVGAMEVCWWLHVQIRYDTGMMKMLNRWKAHPGLCHNESHIVGVPNLVCTCRGRTCLER